MKTVIFEMFYMMMNGCIYAYIYLWFGGIMACDIFLIGGSAMCDSFDRGGRGQIWTKKV